MLALDPFPIDVKDEVRLHHLARHLWAPLALHFDAELGRKIARQNAVSKMWPLLGYHLRTMLKRQEEAAELRAEHGKVG